MTRTAAVIYAAITLTIALTVMVFVRANGGNPWPLVALVLVASYGWLLRDITRRRKP